jgi:hypothetical protein
MHEPPGARADLKGLDRLLAEVHELASAPAQTPRLVHALRNLAHVASLMADVLKEEAARSSVTPGPAPDAPGRSHLRAVE